jgi:hypothetical protein
MGQLVIISSVDPPFRIIWSGGFLKKINQHIIKSFSKRYPVISFFL